jgi:hypothetical protein
VKQALQQLHCRRSGVFNGGDGLRDGASLAMEYLIGPSFEIG